MAPPKLPHKAKTTEKPVVEKTISKKRKSKKNYANFSIFLYRLLKFVTQDKVGISRTSMMVMNTFVYDLLEKLAAESSRLVAIGKKTTLSSREVQTSIKLLVPGELAKHANMEGMKAVNLYLNSRERDSK